jgi:predicted transcriptional regulator
MSDEKPSSRVAEPSPSDLEHDRLLLSDQEAEVVRRTRNKSYATVADELGISESTVGTYRYRANERLDEQVEVIERMLRQQQDDQREEGIKEIAREAVETLRDCGVEVEFEIEPETDESDTGTSAVETTSTQQPQSATATVDMTGVNWVITTSTPSESESMRTRSSTAMSGHSLMLTSRRSCSRPARGHGDGTE